MSADWEDFKMSGSFINSYDGRIEKSNKKDSIY